MVFRGRLLMVCLLDREIAAPTRWSLPSCSRGRLIDAGVDVNRRYGHGLTALMWAAGHDAGAGVDDVDATLKMLLDQRARRDLTDDRGKTAADIARGLGREREAKILEP